MSKKGIEYSDDNFNAYSGCRMTGCSVGKDCWAYGMAHRLKGRFGYCSENPFRPTFHPNMLEKPLKRKKPTRYATCFMGDFAYAKKEWMDKILDVVRRCPQHRFYFLTKCPDRKMLHRLEFPDNAWVGVTINNQDDVWRADELRDNIKAKVKYISFEPLEECIDKINLDGISWVIIGARTGRHPMQPDCKAVLKLILKAKVNGIAIFLKPNLTNFKEDELIQEFPFGSDW